MESLFTNPLTMAAGGALVSAPIIIHLINRMRFRRIKWAAMEFLLKAQKRMRRKLIIEQLILLLLRCLLVFLVGMLLARFRWFSPMEGEESRATAHVVILDDSPSTADVVTADGRQTTAFDLAKTQITEKIAPAAAQANTPQSVDLLLLSDLRQPNDDEKTAKERPTIPKPRNTDRLNEAAIDEMRTFLRPIQPSAVRVSLVEGLRTAKEVLDKKPDSDVAKVIHIVSDLRAADWLEDGETLKQLFTELTTAGVRIHLIDVANPPRKDTERQPRSSDNLSIVEFRPRSRLVSRDQEVNFDLRVKNNGSTEVKDVRVEFFRNGDRWNEVAARFASIPAGEERSEFVRAASGLPQTGTEKEPLRRFNLITAKLADPEAGGLSADNVRHAVVEVREKLKVLVVEGRTALRDKQKGDGFYLKKLLGNTRLGVIEVEEASTAEMEKKDLRDYAAIYLLNVATVGESLRDKLEAYLRSGGGVGFFLGPDVKSEDYNKVLYRGGNDGLFPFPLDKKTPPLTEEQKLKRALVFGKRVLTRDPASRAHPALVGVYTDDAGRPVKDMDVERLFMFANIDRHWEVQRLGRWQSDQAIKELYCLPNSKPMSEFQKAAYELLPKLQAKLAQPKFEKYRKYTDPLDRQIRSTASGDLPPAELARLYDYLICDQINDGDESEAILREMWSQPELVDLKVEFQRERDKVKFGDPLYVVKQFGAGRVAVMTSDAGGTHAVEGSTTAEETWTDWPSSGQAAPVWAIIVSEMHKFLSGGAAEENRSAGAVLRKPLDAVMFQKKNGEMRPAAGVFLTADPAKAEKAGGIPLTRTDLGAIALEPSPAGPVFDFAERGRPAAREPGAYLFTFKQFTGPDGENEKPVYEAYTFNLDAVREGDLKRVNRDDLAQLAPNVPVHATDDTGWLTSLKQKRDDFSTRRWLYLFIILVLVAEQAMAVRLSFHTRPEDLDAHAPSAAAAFAHGATAVPTATAEPEPARV